MGRKKYRVFSGPREKGPQFRCKQVLRTQQHLNFENNLLKAEQKQYTRAFLCYESDGLGSSGIAVVGSICSVNIGAPRQYLHYK
jgi:hypothetical protein